jgi:glycosyltransferase involved in cell wall biosynthesis
MTKPTIHILAPFHTIPDEASSHCAFTGKAIRFSKMMQAYGYPCIEYGNAGSTSEASTKVVMLNAAEYKTHYQPEVKSPGNQATVGTSGYNLFNSRLEAALAQYARSGDIVAHVFGGAHKQLVYKFPGLIHVETGIGYPDDPQGMPRIFESEAWRHYQWGRSGSAGGVLPANRIDISPERTWVVPNYYDPADWPLVDGAPENRVTFMSRFVVDKGIGLLTKLIKAWEKKHPSDGLKFSLAGMGGFPEWFAESDFSPAEAARVDYRGVILGKSRASFVGKSLAFLVPSTFVEPFGGAGVEAMLTGTPVLASSYGAWTETILQGVTGFRCRTVDDYVEGIENAAHLDRKAVSDYASNRFSLRTCGAQYDRIFTELSTKVGIE